MGEGNFSSIFYHLLRQVNMIEKVSVITVVFNGVDNIQHCFDSVKKQSFKNIEYIVIDGASTDGTIDIIAANSETISTFISEPDNGVYDAMNKGISQATGELVFILNSDDKFSDESSVEKIVRVFESTNCDGVHGAHGIFDRRGKRVRNCPIFFNGRKSFYFGGHPRHPTVVLRRAVYSKVGVFDLRYAIASDYDFMYRAFFEERCKLEELNFEPVEMRAGGLSQKSFRNIVKSNLECGSVWLRRGRLWGVIIPIIKPLRKLFSDAV